MSDMAEVIRLHSKFGRDEKGQNCRYCGYHYGNNAGRELHEQAAFHIAAALSAAGFGPVQEAREVAWERCIDHVLVSCTHVTATAEAWRHERLTSDLNEVKAANPYRLEDLDK